MLCAVPAVSCTREALTQWMAPLLQTGCPAHHLQCPGRADGALQQAAACTGCITRQAGCQSTVLQAGKACYLPFEHIGCMQVLSFMMGFKHCISFCMRELAARAA